jgi:hypothetical protein
MIHFQLEVPADRSTAAAVLASFRVTVAGDLVAAIITVAGPGKAEAPRHGYRDYS